MLSIFYPLGSAFITYQKGIAYCTFASPSGAYISVGLRAAGLRSCLLTSPQPAHPVHPPPPPGALRSQPRSPTQPVGLRPSGVPAAARALPTAAPSASTSRPGPSSPTNYNRRVLLAPSPGLGSSVRARIRFSHAERRTIHTLHCLLRVAPAGFWAGDSSLPSTWRSPRTGPASVRWRERTAQSCSAGGAPGSPGQVLLGSRSLSLGEGGEGRGQSVGAEPPRGAGPGLGAGP